MQKSPAERQGTFGYSLFCSVYLSFQIVIRFMYPVNNYVSNCLPAMLSHIRGGRGTHNNDSFSRVRRDVFHLEIFHEQLPLPVPCYDLVLVIEFTLVPLT